MIQYHGPVSDILLGHAEFGKDDQVATWVEHHKDGSQYVTREALILPYGNLLPLSLYALEINEDMARRTIYIRQDYYLMKVVDWAANVATVSFMNMLVGMRRTIPVSKILMNLEDFESIYKDSVVDGLGHVTIDGIDVYGSWLANRGKAYGFTDDAGRIDLVEEYSHPGCMRPSGGIDVVRTRTINMAINPQRIVKSIIV